MSIELLEELKIRAEDSATFHDHELQQWQEHAYRPMIRYNCCVWCDMQVVINANPLPNETYIGGEAIALYCTYEEDNENGRSE